MGVFDKTTQLRRALGLAMAVISVLVVLAGRGKAGDDDLDRVLAALKQQESLVGAMRYSMTRDRKRTREGITFLSERLGSDSVLHSDNPDLIERREIIETRSGDKYRFEETKYDTSLASVIGRRVLRWNGKTASTYHPNDSSGRVSSSNAGHVMYDDTLYSFYFTLEEKPLQEWLQSDNVVVENKGNSVCARFEVAPGGYAEYEFDKSRNMALVGYAIKTSSGETIKEGRTESYQVVEIAGAQLYIPKEFSTSFSIPNTLGMKTIPEEGFVVKYIPTTTTRVTVTSFEPNIEVPDALFDPIFPAGTRVYDTVLGGYIGNPASDAGVGPDAATLAEISDVAETVRENCRVENAAEPEETTSESSSDDLGINRRKLYQLLVAVACLLVLVVGTGVLRRKRKGAAQ